MSEFIKYTGICAECKSDSFPGNCAKIGSSVIGDYSVGKGYARTENSYHQCQVCGSIWQITEDTGAGGYGSYKRRLK